MYSSKVRQLFTGMLSLFAVVTMAAESAIEANYRLIEEVVTIGTRDQYRGNFDVLEAPETTVVLNQLMLDHSGVRDLVSALDLSASVARQNNFGGLWNAYAIRGFTGDQNLPTNYLVNGFNAGRGFAGPRDIAGIEAVEVLKGPRAALFGRGEPGGKVNLITKRPTFNTTGGLRLSTARFNTHRLDVDYTTPLSETVAIRLVGFAEDAESFRDTVETSRHGLMPSLVAALSEATTLVYEMEYTDQEIPFDRGVVAIDGQLGVMSRQTFLGEPADGPLQAEVLGHQLELEHDFSSRLSLLVGLNYRDTSLQGFSTEPELSGSRQQLFVDGRNLTRQRRHRDYDATFLALRSELAADFTAGGLEHRLLFGLDYDEFENDQVFQRYRAPGLSRNPTLDPDFNLPVPAGASLINVPEHTLAAQLVRQFERWTVGGGLLSVDQRLGRTGTDFMLPRYETLRAFVEYTPSASLSVRAEIDNLLNETFYTNSYSDLWVQPGTPAVWRLTADFAFAGR